MVSEKFFNFYKNTNILLKILLFAIVLLFAILWVIGSLAKLDRAIMFVIGVILGVVLIYIYYPEVTTFIDNIIAMLTFK